MNRTLLSVPLAFVVSFGFVSQAFGHAGTQADPLPSAQAAKGSRPVAGCASGSTLLYHRTSQPNNNPQFLQPKCFAAAVLPVVQATNYAAEKPGAKHAGTQADPLPSSVASKGSAPATASCAAGSTLLYHRTTQPNNNPQFLAPACYKDADVKTAQAALYNGEKPAPAAPTAAPKAPTPAPTAATGGIRHAGTPADPLPSAVASKGSAPLASCAAGSTLLYHRTTKPDNNPQFLKPACYKDTDVKTVQAVKYASEK